MFRESGNKDSLDAEKQDILKFIKSGLKDEILDDLSDEELFNLIKTHKKYLQMLKNEHDTVKA